MSLPFRRPMGGRECQAILAVACSLNNDWLTMRSKSFHWLIFVSQSKLSLRALNQSKYQGCDKTKIVHNVAPPWLSFAAGVMLVAIRFFNLGRLPGMMVSHVASEKSDLILSNTSYVSDYCIKIPF